MGKKHNFKNEVMPRLSEVTLDWCLLFIRHDDKWKVTTFKKWMPHTQDLFKTDNLLVAGMKQLNWLGMNHLSWVRIVWVRNNW